MLIVRELVRNKVGLHARPASIFVQCASKFRSRISIHNISSGGQPVNAKSILHVLSLGVSQGDEVELLIDGDDEVAVIFDPQTLRPLCEPLVNIRFNLDLACRKGIISEQSMKRLFHAVRSLYFPLRTYQRMLLDGSNVVPSEELDSLRDYLENEKRDFKMEDAILALERAREAGRRGGIR